MFYDILFWGSVGASIVTAMLFTYAAFYKGPPDGDGLAAAMLGFIAFLFAVAGWAVIGAIALFT